MVNFVSTILLGLSAFQLAYAADGTVTFFRDRDCKGTNMWEGKVGKGTDQRVSGPDLHEALSFSYSGYFNMIIATSSKFDSKTCSYCSNNHEDHHEGGCININTGFGPNYVALMKVGNDPADLPCRNFLNRCDFPVPPGNGLEKQ
ncbi:hypothetical protein DIS24_g10268 [Lasiodiplodia hormozganensis]|uniref:Uncharacterized protein n=1 Tax=Lasiodiplodia hormozganensis TaxID=869390 RepID=A0AA39XQ07_9PEZI|nr:hypothetical protein DIS24_g10268 [Lasiodiplodia hormozganensis]